MTPFEIVAEISKGKTPFDDPLFNPKDYVAWVVNGALSGHRETVLQANEVNRMSHIPVKAQAAFLANSIRPAKRYCKWYKSQNTSEDVTAVSEFFKVSKKIAAQYLSVLTPEHIAAIHRSLTTGGVQRAQTVS